MITAYRATGILYRFLIAINEKVKGIFLLPANICPIVPLCFDTAAVPFTFVDIDQQSLCMDLAFCINLLEKNPEKYAGLLYVRNYGYISNEASNAFEYIKKVNENFIIIDDRCLCMPYWGEKDKYSDLELYSTGYAKPVDIGMGAFGKLANGMSLVDLNFHFDFAAEKAIERYCKKAINEKKRIVYFPHHWINTAPLPIPDDSYFRIVESHKEKMLLHKSIVNEIYYNSLPGEICLDDSFNSWRFNIRVKNAKEVLKKIFSGGLFASNHYQNSSVLFNKRKFHASELLAKEVINLFNDKYFSTDQAERICQLIISS